MQCTALNWTTLHCTAPHFTAQRFYWSVLHYTALKKLSYKVIFSRYCNKLQFFAVYLYCSSSVLLPTPVYSASTPPLGPGGDVGRAGDLLGQAAPTLLHSCRVYSVHYCNIVQCTVYSTAIMYIVQCTVYSTAIIYSVTVFQCYSTAIMYSVQCTVLQ